MLKPFYQNELIEAGCDEAGRGCLAGPVFAAAVILPEGYSNELLNDSKKLNIKQRNSLRIEIEKNALAWSVASVSNITIDEINILQASFLAMHKAIEGLSVNPQFLIIDGNRFKPYKNTEHKCIIKGDGIYASIAAASILAKTHRDEYMEKIHYKFPLYGWIKNKGYATELHRKAIALNGISPHHRKSFNLNEQLKLKFG
ncbi:MAG: ribonuclease HII [Bacteroidales bacterium]|nr:ribonuclease HII [Bacteroidales bacterium]